MPTLIARNLKNLQDALESKRFKNKKIGMVPTMGAIHEGHLALVKKSIKVSEITIVTIFINPIQFNNKKDLENYPKSLKNDISLLIKQKVDLIFAPDKKDMYPEDFSTYINLKKFSDILCGKKRKRHFSGVATVVLKLFSLIKPNLAFFGEKDYQQLVIIKKLVKDLNLNIKIHSIKTVRDQNGLALSSRNKLLTEKEKLRASNIYLTLKEIAKKELEDYESELVKIKKRLLNLRIGNIEYLEIRDEKSLELYNPKNERNKNYRVFIAVKIGNIRLIDNKKLKK